MPSLLLHHHRYDCQVARRLSKEEWNKKIPLRRGGTPEEIAKVALFLGSDLSSYVSGQVIEVNGA